MDSGSIIPVDESYFQNIRESGYEKRISELEAEIKKLRLEKSKINDELSTLQTKMRLVNAQKYFRDNGCMSMVYLIQGEGI